MRRLVDRLRAEHPEAAAAAEAAKLAVGPWHLLPHGASCHVLYNPRLMEGAALTYGDVIEHLWAKLRAFGSVSAYMGDDNREPFLALVVSGGAACANDDVPCIACMYGMAWHAYSFPSGVACV